MCICLIRHLARIQLRVTKLDYCDSLHVRFAVALATMGSLLVYKMGGAKCEVAK